MEGLLILAALFFLALPIISFIMVLNANGRLKRIEERLANVSKLAFGEANLNEETQTRLEAIEEYLNGSAEFTAKPSMPEKSADDKISEVIDDEPLPEEVRQEEEPSATAQEDESELPLAAQEEGPGPEQADLSGSQTSDSPEPKTAKVDFESLVGGRWSVLLGGFALALGLVFLVQYTIEAGLLGPGPRIILGFVFSGLLFAAGEWLRRSDKSFDLPIYAKADVPGILTGAGAIGAFATLYAAHALYGFVGPGFAFVGLTLVGIATMLLSSIHGPKLAAIGVLGAYVAPILVDSREPNPIALALHVIAVTAVVMAMARLRNWPWLAIAASIFSTLWIMLAAISHGPSNGIAGAMMVISIAAIFVITYGLHEFQNRKIEDSPTSWITVLSFTLLTLGFVVQLVANHQLPENATALIMALIIMGGASMAAPLSTTAIHATVITLVTLLLSRLSYEIIPSITTTDDFLRGIVPRDTYGFLRTAFLLGLPLQFWLSGAVGAVLKTQGGKLVGWQSQHPH